MKKRFTEERIAFALRQAEGGTPVTEVCRKMGVSEQSFYRWKKKYMGMGIAELRRLRQLEEENRKLKKEECLDLHWFKTIEEAKGKIEAWRVDYSEHRPHSALKDQTPSEFAESFDLSRAVEKAGC